MKKVRVEDAVGMVLGHDLTKIVPGEFKGAAFKKGQVITAADIDVLKNMGKYHIYVIDLEDNYIHEDEASIRIGQAAAGEGVYLKGPVEGKISINAQVKGILKINLSLLTEINDIDSVILATLHSNTLVEKDRNVAGTRIIPLTVEKKKIIEIESICNKRGPIISINEIKPLKVGIVVTGTEVYEGRIQDRFGPVLQGKVNQYGAKTAGIKYAPDEQKEIQIAISSLIKQGAEVILTAGGMSVDADDVTPSAIQAIADEVITYGSPVLPGAMFMLAYRNQVTILGIPACGMYFRTTVLDLVFPRVLSGEVLSRKDINSLAHGGLCLGCEECRYPVCPFGK